MTMEICPHCRQPANRLVECPWCRRPVCLERCAPEGDAEDFWVRERAAEEDIALLLGDTFEIGAVPNTVP